MRTLKGTIVSDKMQKTRVVEIMRLVRHPRYHKYYTVSRRFKAHDEKNEYRTGEVVIIGEGRPLSRGKRWVIVRKA
ncbi:MAG: 30S ribosomal protein S17 [Patescibacteria group bacterium]